jgi:beta-lactamase class A
MTLLRLTIVSFRLCSLAIAVAMPATGAPVQPHCAVAGSSPATPALGDLWRFPDAALQAGLERILSDQGLQEPVRAQRIAVVIADITDPARPKVAAINGDEMMYAASLPKIAILLGAFDRARREGIALPETIAADAEQMIRYSSNPAATRVLDWAGRDRLLDLLQSPELRLYDPAHNGGLWVGKAYAAGPAYRRDPLHNLSHGATAMQAARFLYLLETGRLVDPDSSRRMKAMLANPGTRHKLVAGLAARPQATLYRKSGTWKRHHADAALVESGGNTFILVAIADDPSGGDWIASLAAPLHDLVAPASPAAPRAGEGH